LPVLNRIACRERHGTGPPVMVLDQHPSHRG
jgi:hypothetical protein